MFGTLASAGTFGNYGAGSSLFWVDPELDVSFAALSAGVMSQAANIERFQSQTPFDPFGGHQQPGHQGAPIEDVKRAFAEEIPRVADGAQAIVILDIDQGGGSQQPCTDQGARYVRSPPDSMRLGDRRHRLSLAQGPPQERVFGTEGEYR